MIKRIILATIVCLNFMGIFSYAQGDIKRIAGGNRYETAVKISKEVYDKSETVVLVSGENFADTLTGQNYALSKSMPILLTNKNKIPEVVIGEISRLGAKNILVIGGNNSITEDCLKALTGMKITRVAGKDRIETSRLVSRLYEKKLEMVGIAQKSDFPDAICASRLVHKNKGAIILSDYHGVDLSEFLNVPKTVFGGVDSISDSFVKNIDGKRINGSNRYETSMVIAKATQDDLSKVIIVSGKNYSDGLVSSMISGKISQPILLADSDNDVSRIFEFFPNIKTVFIIGGESSVSKDVEKAVSRRLERNDITIDTPVVDEPVEKYVNIPDKNFLKVINKNIDKNREDDQRVTFEEMKKIVSLNVDLSDGTPIIPLEKIEYLNGETPVKDQMVKRKIKSIEGIQYAVNLEKLDISETYVKDISRLKNLNKLKFLELDRNNIEDVTPLKDLVSLEHLKLYNNYIKDISSLNKLVNLVYLDVHYNVDENGENGIIDVSPVKNMKKLEDLDLSANSIKDISPLSGLQNIKNLDLSGNHIGNIEPISDIIIKLLNKFIEEEPGYSINFMGQSVEIDKPLMLKEGENKVVFENPYKYKNIAKHFDLPSIIDSATIDEGYEISYDPISDNFEVTVPEGKEIYRIQNISLESYSIGLRTTIKNVVIKR